MGEGGTGCGVSGIPFKVLLYDSLVGDVTSGHVMIKMVVTLFNCHGRRPPAIRKLYSCLLSVWDYCQLNLYIA